MGGLLITITPEAQDLIQFANTFLATAHAIKISNEDEAQLAVDQTRAIKECAKAVDETRKGYTMPLDEQKKYFMDVFRPAAEVLEKSEKVLKAEIGAWNTTRHLRAAEAEKARRAAEALERKRQEEEQNAAAELLRQADDASAYGNYALAEALEEQAAAAQAVAEPIACPVALAIENPKGASSRTIWKCRVLDPSLVPASFLMPNQALLDTLAATAKGAGAPPSGCEWTSTTSTSIR